MKKLLFFLLLCSPLMWPGEGFSDSKKPPAKAPSIRKVGVIAPLTGTTASFGVTVQNSVLLAEQKYHSEGIVQFLFEDDQLQPKNTVAAANKLLTEDKVDALIVFGSPTALAVNSIAEQAEKPMIALSIVDKVVEGKKFVMKHWVPARVENALITKEVARLGYKKIAVVTTQNDAMLSLRDAFRDSHVVSLVLDEEFPRDITDFRTIASKIRSLEPDAVYSLLWAPQPGIFARQLREKGYTGPIFGAHNLEDGNERIVSQGALTGAWFVTGDDRGAREYFREYQIKFHSSPTAGGVNAFDVAKMFIDTAKAKDLNAALHELKDFQGANGTYSATPQNDFEISAILKRIGKDGFEAQ